MGEVCEHSNHKNDNIDEKRSGGDNRVQPYIEGCVFSYKQRNKTHPDQYHKIEEYIVRGSGAG